MQLFEKNNTLSGRHVKTDQSTWDQVPDDFLLRCPKCQRVIFRDQLDEYMTCPSCDYGFRISAKKRLEWLVDDYEEWDAGISPADPLHFPGYEQTIAKGEKHSGLKESVWTGKADFGGQKAALGIMDPTFIMGSLGQATGEKITRMFERAIAGKLPVVLFTASGGARMQEGIFSLMQMAKVSNAVDQLKKAGLAYIVVLTDPTTGGVTASFASEGDYTFAEPRAMVAFAGRRVIEQTIHEKLAKDAQDAETVMRHGFIDAIVSRQDEKTTISWFLKNGGRHESGN